MLTIAHVSDPHLGGRPEAEARLARVLDHVLAMDPAPDLLVVTGDIADHGDPVEYATAHEILGRWPGPLLVGTGNHDVQEPFAALLLGADRTDPRREHEPLDQESVGRRVPVPHAGLGRACGRRGPAGPWMARCLDAHLARRSAGSLRPAHLRLPPPSAGDGGDLLVGGGVVSSVTLDGEPLPHLWLEAPPTMALHQVLDDGRLVTFWRAIP